MNNGSIGAKLGVSGMVAYDKRLDFLTTIHSLAQLNFSAVLSQISQAEFLVMSAINKLERLHSSSNYGISNIADSLRVSSPAISRTITALENKGYVERKIDKLNRRNTLVRLTESGTEVFQNECDRIYQFMNNVVNRMGEDKLNELFLLSNELLENVEKEIKSRENN